MAGRSWPRCFAALALLLAHCSDQEALPSLPLPPPAPPGASGAGGSPGPFPTESTGGGPSEGPAGAAGVDGVFGGGPGVAGGIGVAGNLGGEPQGGNTGSAGAEGIAGAPVSLFCGDGVLGAQEECDPGPPPQAATLLPCSAQCQVQDMALPVVPGASPGGQRLGLGRHSVAGAAQGFAVAFVSPTAGQARVALARFDAHGFFHGIVEDLSQGGGSDLWGNPVVAALGDGSYVVAWTDRFLDGDALSVALRKVSAEGVPLGPPKVAHAQASFVQKQPDLVWNGAELIAAWIDESDPFTAPDLRLRRFTADLTPLGPEESLAATEANEAAVALAPLPGSWAAAWRSVADGEETLEVTTGQGISWSFGPYPVSFGDERPALVALDATRLLVAFSVAPTFAALPELRFVLLDLVTPEKVSLLAWPTGATGAPPGGQTQPALVISGEDLLVAWRAAAIPGTAEGEELWGRFLGWNPGPGELLLAGQDFPLPRRKIHRFGDQRYPVLAPVGGAKPSLVFAWDDVGSGVFGEANLSRVMVQVAPLPLLRLDPGGVPESSLEACSNGLDDDDDGLTDCADGDCDTFCEVSFDNCTDGIDNDGDGLIDCADPQCALQFVCPEGTGFPGTCENGIDDDKDGLIDLQDPGCLNL